MHIRTIETRTHGRYLVAAPPHPRTPAPYLVGFHGYGENATLQLEVLKQIVGQRPWVVVSVQALNRFYNKASDVVASWMTREDRELAIADNITYVTAVIAAAEREYGPAGTLVYTGFSQGVAMAYRAAACAGRPCHGVIALAGDVPPDVAPVAAMLPPTLIGRGAADAWYTPDKAAADVAVLGGAGVTVAEYVFEGGHVWDSSFIDRAGAFLDERWRA